jgi:hypothetical protein
MKVGIECERCGEIRTVVVTDGGPNMSDRTPDCDCEVAL